MTSPARKREVGRGERVVPGVWRLRLPLGFPGVPHCNAWALAAGDGIVLVDCGMHQPGSMAHLERALAMVNLRLEHVRLLVCTHTHADHYGQAADVIEAAGCELWMHPNHEHITSNVEDPDRSLERRIEVARTSGVPEEALQRFYEERKGQPIGVKAVVLPDRELVDGVEISTDVGRWVTYETPGHAPSHVCLFQPERRMLISGDHILGRVSPYFDMATESDPVGEFVTSLDVCERLDARLALSGHGRTFTDVQGHIDAYREYVDDVQSRVERVVAEQGPITAFDIIEHAWPGDDIGPVGAAWRLPETRAFLRHLEALGRVAADDGHPQQWATV